MSNVASKLGDISETNTEGGDVIILVLAGISDYVEKLGHISTKVANLGRLNIGYEYIFTNRVEIRNNSHKKSQICPLEG